MNCNEDIHNELKESGEISCPFCDQKLEYSNEKPKKDLCCDDQYIINDDGMLACLSCGVVQGYNYVKEYVNFYENIHRFIRKSVYHRESTTLTTYYSISKKNITLKYQTVRNIRLMLYLLR